MGNAKRHERIRDGQVERSGPPLSIVLDCGADARDLQIHENQIRGRRTNMLSATSNAMRGRPDT